MLIVRIRVPTCCVNIKHDVFYMICLTSSGNVACSTTLLSMRSCCAMSNSIWCEKTHIKNMIFDVHTARRDTYPYNERWIQWAEVFSILRDPSDVTSNIELQTFKYRAQNLQTSVFDRGCVCIRIGMCACVCVTREREGDYVINKDFPVNTCYQGNPLLNTTFPVNFPVNTI